MKILILLITLLAFSPMAFAKNSFQSCIQDIQNTSKSLTMAGKSLDGIFASYNMKNFNHFANLVRTGDNKYIEKAEATLARRNESLTSYGFNILQSVQRSLPELRTNAGKCRRSCNALNSSVQHERNLQIKCDQLNHIAAGFVGFLKSPSQETITNATNAIVVMKGTQRNEQIIDLSIQALKDISTKAQASSDEGTLPGVSSSSAAAVAN